VHTAARAIKRIQETVHLNLPELQAVKHELQNQNHISTILRFHDATDPTRLLVPGVIIIVVISKCKCKLVFVNFLISYTLFYRINI